MMAGLAGGTETLLDWAEIKADSGPVKEGFMMMMASDGSWQDVRVVLKSTYLSVQKLITRRLELVQGC